MKYGELDAGRADMLILYREKHEISDKDDLQKISGFNGFDTKKLEQNFIIAPLPKEEPKPKKEEPKVTERIIEKRSTRIAIHSIRVAMKMSADMEISRLQIHFTMFIMMDIIVMKFNLNNGSLSAKFSSKIQKSARNYSK